MAIVILKCLRILQIRKCARAAARQNAIGSACRILRWTMQGQLNSLSIYSNSDPNMLRIPQFRNYIPRGHAKNAIGNVCRKLS